MTDQDAGDGGIATLVRREIDDPITTSPGGRAPGVEAGPRTSRKRLSWHPRTPKLRRPRMTEGRVVFLLALVAYLAIGVRLAFFADVLHGDALARVGNAYYTLFSRDPHLAAVGFVWNPLPSLVLIPFLPLKLLWPDLTRIGFIGNIESAVFMACAVAVLRGCLYDMRVRRDTRLVITVLFAVHPLILVHGGYGTTEGMFVVFLLLACRYLMRWFDDDSLGGLIGAGFALGAAYMTRYEAVGAGFATVAVVAVVAYRRALGARRQRRQIAFAETCVVAIPFGFSMAAWAGASWLVIGSPFATLTSQYGSASQTRYGQSALITAFGGDDFPSRAEFAIRQLFALEPFVFLVVAIGTLLAWRRGDSRIWAILTPLGGTAGFIFLSLSSGRIFPFLRYSIAVVPLTALLVGYLFSPTRRDNRATTAAAVASDATQPFLYALPIFLTIILLAPSLTSTTNGISRGLGSEEAAPMHALVGANLPGNTLWRAAYFEPSRQIANYIDALGLRDAAVLSDTAFSYSVVLASKRPKQFIVTSDLDFEQSVADPVQFGVRYILVPSRTSSPWDAVNLQDPSFYENGSGIATLTKEWPDSYPKWRLFRITTGTTSGPATADDPPSRDSVGITRVRSRTAS